jgi:capsular polysaccharide biosynthesis protein
MAIDPERFSELTNALQAAAVLARERVILARGDSASADQLFDAVSRAVDAARQLRTNGGGQ